MATKPLFLHRLWFQLMIRGLPCWRAWNRKPVGLEGRWVREIWRLLGVPECDRMAGSCLCI